MPKLNLSMENLLRITKAYQKKSALMITFHNGKMSARRSMQLNKLRNLAGTWSGQSLVLRVEFPTQSKL
eukprot:1139038-Pelagomonas_calceolata.AAC.3